MFEKFNELSQQEIRSSCDQLKDFIYRIQENKFDWADKLRNQITTVEELQGYNKMMRARFIEGIGGLPEPQEPLNARVVRTSDEGEFTLEAIVFNSRPNTYVTASMYIPKGIVQPSPAVLFVCGHTTEGRMDPTYQMVCRTLVRAGLIVFAIDPIGQGERSDFYDAKTNVYQVHRGSADHDACGIPAVATGKYLERYFLCDEIRAVDYMLTRPEIDPQRIGITGNSGGGTQTLAMMACDERIAAAAPGTFVSNRREIMYSGKTQDSEQIWPGITGFGFDHVNPFLIFAPRPVAILAVFCDFFPIEGTKETYKIAKRFYGMYEKEENLQMYEDNYVHEYTRKLAVSAAEFFTEVFLGEKKTVTNDDMEPLSLEVMRVTKSGNILGEISDTETVWEHVRVNAMQQRNTRTKLQTAERRSRAKQWLTERVMHNRIPVEFNVRIYPKTYGTQVINGYMGIPVSWWSQRRLFSFGILIKEEKYEHVDNMPTVIAIWTDGTKKTDIHDEWIRKQCDAGKQVLVLDVPGVGDLEQSPLAVDMPYKDRDGTLFRLCCDLIYTGDSMAAMHCYDVLRTIEMLETEFHIKAEDISLYCEGQDGVYGIMAGFLNENVKMEYGEGLLLNVENEIVGKKNFKYDNTLSLIIPGMLEHFDYVELIR